MTKRYLLLPLGICLLGSICCSHKSAEFQPEEVPVTEKDAFFGPEIKGKFVDGEWRTTELHLLQSGGEQEPPLAATTASMFNQSGANPILVRFNNQGQVDVVLRLAVVSGTAEEIEKKTQELKPYGDLIDKLYSSLSAKKLDMRKLEDRTRSSRRS